MDTKEITLRDADGKFGRMNFRPLFRDKEWSQMRGLVQGDSSLGEEVAQLVDALPRMTMQDGKGYIGWWLPRAFQVKHCVCDVPSSTSTTPEGLGWIPSHALARHKKALLALCEAHPKLNHLGYSRLYTRKSNQEHSWDTKEFDPFEGISGVKRMLDAGSRIEEENTADLLCMQGTVIYHPEYDAYLDFQNGWRQLNRAKVFPTAQEAEEIIRSNRIPAGAMTATLSLRVDGFSKPHMVGDKVRQALSEREGETLERATPPASRVDGRRRI